MQRGALLGPRLQEDVRLLTADVDRVLGEQRGRLQLARVGPRDAVRESGIQGLEGPCNGRGASGKSARARNPRLRPIVRRARSARLFLSLSEDEVGINGSHGSGHKEARTMGKEE